jgi:hypothetical protein
MPITINERHKLIILAGSLVLIIILVILLVLYILRPKQPDYIPDTPTITGVPTIFRPSISLIPDEKVPTTPPTPTKEPDDLILSGIPVDNFYKDAARILPNNDVVLVENENYQIVYLAEFEEFNISITGKNFDLLQKEAEKIFLEKVGLDPANACRLTIVVTAPAYAKHEYAGIQLTPSFCEQHAESAD